MPSLNQAAFENRIEVGAKVGMAVMIPSAVVEAVVLMDVTFSG